MTDIERMRCPHCVGPISTVEIRGTDFVEHGPALLCERCDRGPADDEPLLLPVDWE